MADVVRGTRPPFDPQQVVKSYASLVREYRISHVRGDSYSAEWVASAFKDCGINYEPANKNKSALYLEALPLFTRGAISIPISFRCYASCACSSAPLIVAEGQH